MLDSLIGGFRPLIRKGVRHTKRKNSARYDTSDVIQEGMLQVWTEWLRTSENGDEFEYNEAYLKTIGKGQACTMRRFHSARKRAESVEETSALVDRSISPVTDPVEFVERQEETLRMMRAISSMEGDDRKVLYLKFFDQKSLRQIAGDMQLSVNVTRRILRNAVANLKRRLQNESATRAVGEDHGKD